MLEAEFRLFVAIAALGGRPKNIRPGIATNPPPVAIPPMKPEANPNKRAVNINIASFTYILKSSAKAKLN
jgi:hypothetical protein